MLPRCAKLAETYPLISAVRGRARWSRVELCSSTLEPTRPAVCAVRRLSTGGPALLSAGTYGNVLRSLAAPRQSGDTMLDEGL